MRAIPGASRPSPLSRLAWLAVIVVSAIAVGACSGSGAGPSAAIQSETPAPAASASVSPAATDPSSGGDRGDYDYDYGAGTGPSPASEAPGPAAVEVGTASGPLGTWLTGAGGLTLYAFEPDGESTSSCDDDCAQAWPPFTVETDATLEPGDGVGGVLTTFERSDGTLQVAYDGAPLYYFANDTGPGDTNGQGLGDVWFVAEP